MHALRIKGTATRLPQMSLFAIALSIGCSGPNPEKVEVPVPESTQGMNNELVQEINRLVAKLDGDEPAPESYL